MTKEEQKQAVEQAVMEYREFDDGTYIRGFIDWYYMPKSNSIGFKITGTPQNETAEYIGQTFNGEPINF